MKRILLILLVFISCFSVFATSLFSEKTKEIFSDIEFTPISFRPLYEDYKADLWNFDNQADFMFLQGKGINSILVQTRYEAGREKYYYNFDKVNGEFTEQQVNELVMFTDDNYKYLLRAKPSLSFSVLRLKYKDFTLEGFLQYGFSVAIAMQGATDLLAYDGMYAYGANAAYKDILDVRLGLHHYSGHYGDEVVDELLEQKDEKGRYYADRFEMKSDIAGSITKATEYIRQDGLIIGLSVRPNKYIRAYFEADFILNNMNTVRPYILVPNNVNCTVDNQDMAHRIGDSEHAINNEKDDRLYPYSDKYRAYIFNTGIELYYKFKKAGQISLAYNCRLNQEGQTMYQFNCYKEDNPWDIDHTLRLSYEFENVPLELTATYHNGRIPMLNYYFYHDSFFSLGLSVNL